MNARMEKYASTGTKSRTSKNEKLYDEVQDMNIDYVNIDVNNAVELNPNLSSKSKREDYQKQRELNKILPKNEERVKFINEEVEDKENRVYDINEILKMARENKLFEDSDKKRLINTEYNILTKLDVEKIESEEMKKEDLKSLINDIYEKEKPLVDREDVQGSDEELLNDLFDDLKEEEISLKEELSKAILDKEDSLEEVKIKDVQITEDVKLKEQVEEIKEEKSEDAHHEEREMSDDYVEDIKEGKGLMIAIIIVTILILLTGAFFIYEYFFSV